MVAHPCQLYISSGGKIGRGIFLKGNRRKSLPPMPAIDLATHHEFDVRSNCLLHGFAISQSDNCIVGSRIQ